MIRKVVQHLGLAGQHEMRTAVTEVISSLNARPTASGISPSVLVFGKRIKLYGEIWEDGRPHSYHPAADDPQSVLANRLEIRTSAKQAVERWFAREMLRRSVASRSHPIQEVSVGDVVFFYKENRSLPGKKGPRTKGAYLGPAIVIGTQRSNAWVTFAGRCFLVSREHLRGLSPRKLGLSGQQWKNP